MKKMTCVILAAAALLALLGGCSSMRGRGRGPVDAFMLLAAGNPGLTRDVAGSINERSDPKTIELVVPPGTDKSRLVATLSLNSEATITVISSGSPVVQTNGRTANDFTAPVTYSLEVPGEEEPWLYRVSVREADTDAKLAGIVFPEGYALAPGFSPDVQSYRVEVPYATRIVKIEARGRSRLLGSITIGTVESRGAAAVAGVDFSAGDSLDFTITTLAEDGVTAEQYTVTLLRGAPDSNAALAGLEIGGGLLSPRFVPERLTYMAQVPFATTAVTVAATPQSSFATVSVVETPEGARPGSSAFQYQQLTDARQGGSLEFRGGERLPLLVTVTAQDGSVQEYRVEIIRAAPDRNNLLASLEVADGSLSPVFTAAARAFGATVPYASREVRITARPQSSVAEVVLEPGSEVEAAMPGGFTYRGDPAEQGAVIGFAAGERLSVLVRVTAEDGSVQRYLLKIRRGAPDSNADLASLTVSSGVLRPLFSPRTASYVVSLPAAEGSVQLALRAASSVATVSWVDQPSLPAAISQAVSVALNPGEARVVSFAVTAQDGSERLYRIEVRRAGTPAAQPPAQPPVQPPAQPPVQPPAQPPVQPPVQPPAAQPPAAQPPAAQPLSGRVVVEAKNLRLEEREAAALTAEKALIGSAARITVRTYRTNDILLQDTTPVQARRQGKTWALTLAYRSGSLALSGGRLVEIEVAIPTSSGSYLHYTEAFWSAAEMNLTPPFLLFGRDPRVAWPAVGSPVPVEGYVSLRPPGRGGAGPEVGEEEFERNTQGEYGISVAISDAAGGRLLGSDTVWTRPGLARGRVFGFSKPMQLPEGAAVRCLLEAKAKNGRLWRSEGFTEVWTTRLEYAGGFQPVVLLVAGD
jgi:hypothetical protein